MKKLMNRALAYGVLALAAGVFYREFTKWNGYSGRTALAFMHPHLLALGTGLCLLTALFARSFPLDQDRRYRAFLRLHDIGLPLTVLMLLARGVLEVLGTALSKGMDAGVSGVAGVGHLLLGAAIICLLLALRHAVAAAK